jgi:hypothetical protein
MRNVGNCCLLTTSHIELLLARSLYKVCDIHHTRYTSLLLLSAPCVTVVTTDITNEHDIIRL